MAALYGDRFTPPSLKRNRLELTLGVTKLCYELKKAKAGFGNLHPLGWWHFEHRPQSQSQQRDSIFSDYPQLNNLKPRSSLYRDEYSGYSQSSAQEVSSRLQYKITGRPMRESRLSKFCPDSDCMDASMMELDRLMYKLRRADPVQVQHQNPMKGERLQYSYHAFPEQEHFHSSSSSIEEFSLHEAEVKQNAHSEEISNLKKQLGKYEDNLKKQTEELEQTKTRLDNSNQRGQEADQKHSKEISELRKKLEKSGSNEETLTQQLQQSQEKAKKAIEELNNTKTRLNTVQKAIKVEEKSQISYSKESQEIIDLRTQLKTVMSKEAIASRLLEETSDTLQRTRDELDIAKSRLNDAQQINMHQKERDAQKLSDTAEALKKSQNTETELKQLLQESKDRLKASQQSQDRKTKLAETEKFSELRDQELSQEISDLRKQLDKSEFKERATNHQLQQTQDKLNKTQDELEETKTRLNGALQEIEKTFKKMEMQNSDLRTNLEKSKSTEESLNHQLQQVRNKIQTTTAELEDTKTRLTDAQHQKERDLRKLSDVTEALKKSKCMELELKQLLQESHNRVKATQQSQDRKTKLVETEKFSELRDQELSQEISDLRKQLEKSGFKERATNHQLQQTQDKLNKTKDELEETKSRLKEALQGIDTHLKKMEKENSDLRTQLEKSTEASLNHQLQQVRTKLKTTTEELEDTKTRLSKLMGQKLTDNNPNITDLSDKNRPMKIGERFSELYDNEWTDAFEVVRSIYKDERTTVLTLLTILKDADKFCKAEAEKQIECLRKDLTLQLETDGSNIPSLINKQLKDCRKALGSDAGHRLLEIYIKKLSQSSSASARDALRVEPFLREAFPLCWLMSIQDPPVVFDRLLQHGEKFNTELYRSYTKAGPLVDFPVWPTMFLHEGGPLLYKGVAQGCDK